MKEVLIINTALDKNNLEWAQNICRKIKTGDIIHYSLVTNNLLQRYRKVIISGCQLDDKQAVIKELNFFKWIRSFNKPLLGICCGHQIIGKSFGSKLIHDKESEIGKYHIHVNVRGPILKYLRSNFIAYEVHNDSITLPQNFILLAHSNKCRVEIMKHKDKHIYGVEFHPEKNEKHSRILHNFLAL